DMGRRSEGSDTVVVEGVDRGIDGRVADHLPRVLDVPGGTIDAGAQGSEIDGKTVLPQGRMKRGASGDWIRDARVGDPGDPTAGIDGIGSGELATRYRCETLEDAVLPAEPEGDEAAAVRILGGGVGRSSDGPRVIQKLASGSDQGAVRRGTSQ